MTRSGPIEVTIQADWSHWRDVRVPLDEPTTDTFLVRVENHLRRGEVTGFESLSFDPGTPVLAIVLNEPREDIDTITAEVDGCIAAASGSGTSR
jgi:hypothetical protein